MSYEAWRISYQSSEQAARAAWKELGMTRYPNSACEEHRNVKTSEPVCIICMAEEIERLRTLAKAHLDARDKEARAKMSFDVAEENYSNSDPEAREYEKAMVAASAADKALRDELTPNALAQAAGAPAFDETKGGRSGSPAAEGSPA